MNGVLEPLLQGDSSTDHLIEIFFWLLFEAQQILSRLIEVNIEMIGINFFIFNAHMVELFQHTIPFLYFKVGLSND